MADFTLDDLVQCYRTGIFPMSDARDDETLFLVDPPLRGILPLEGVHVPSRLARTVRNTTFTVKIDTAFRQVIELCAESAADRESTWISHSIQSLYEALFARGLAHSVEVWDGARLVGGLYGVAINGAFFGESMVSRATDASKIALVHLVARLRAGGYRLLDCQFLTDHLRQFGVIEIPREDYKARLKDALSVEGDFYRLATAVTGKGVLQLTTQTS
ncbi:leucyl/phenylalanyl-tRNA--protein transferase [Asticcacaulis sp. DW145]|uniref:Leucyl/phenylalanyl-tRNA--protein transferase n=1 Tax=Asticcacaulis currens TaxID=2984210 RepID=A0ABT5IGF7_9CAUL|nr:leucyl/phenylalanyl-tRNA--protein transferase [Asticcacaulis currens]MDC7695269.1 leucyl/phenylalanyl-tRNA--protein transferase [Asticcacaulis currens]BEV12518.1 leucyl/phenylalanyl-tRNA--protein transferase [Asticcacaulis sp. DW145]